MIRMNFYKEKEHLSLLIKFMKGNLEIQKYKVKAKLHIRIQEMFLKEISLKIKKMERLKCLFMVRYWREI